MNSTMNQGVWKIRGKAYKPGKFYNTRHSEHLNAQFIKLFEILPVFKFMFDGMRKR
jgi:hypothetical protein